MARYYLWTWRRSFTAQYLLVGQRSVGVFSFFSGSSRVLVEPSKPSVGYKANPLIRKAVEPMLSRVWRIEPRPMG